jgi:hypothetical protein
LLLEIYGAGAGPTPAALGEMAALVWKLMRDGRLQANLATVALADIEAAWQRPLHGQRLVVVP